MCSVCLIYKPLTECINENNLTNGVKKSLHELTTLYSENNYVESLSNVYNPLINKDLNHVD